MKYTAVVQDGKLKMSDYGREVFKQFLRKNNGARIELVPILPESQKLRNWFEGAVVPLITFYQEGEGLDHRNGEERVLDWLVENYQPPEEALDPEKYKAWRDTIYPFSGPYDPDNYISYLISIGILR